MCWIVDLISIDIGDCSSPMVEEHLKNMSEAVDRAKLLVVDLSKTLAIHGQTAVINSGRPRRGEASPREAIGKRHE